jgi:hypothetical protein
MTMRKNDVCTLYTLKNGKKTIYIAEMPLNNGENREAGLFPAGLYAITVYSYYKRA